MSEFMRLYRERVDRALEPHREVYGDDAPVVKMGLRLLAEAEEIEAQLQEVRLTTAEASERTGWHPETLQKYARAVIAGEDVPEAWAGLIVELDAGGKYRFVLGSIPRRSAA